MIRLTLRKAALAGFGVLLAGLLVWGLNAEKELSVRLLYATQGETYDPAALSHLEQSLTAGLRLDKAPLASLSLRKLQAYDTIMLDPALHGQLSEANIQTLRDYVNRGGHLFLENAFATDIPADLLGAKEIVDVPAPNRKISGQLTVGDADPLSFPATDYNATGLQTLLKQFADTYFRHDPANGLSAFSWGKGIVPSTAETIASLDQISLYTLNRYGAGTVFFCGTLLPNRYYMTGYDLTSGMDPKLGFERLATAANAAVKTTPGAQYFDLKQRPQQPFFHFTFAAGSALLRSEYAAFVEKEKLGYSVKKVLGPYGRPAMAYQNHFEALEAIRDKEGIQWAELLKGYKQIPSFSLVRSSFTWGRWQEGAVVHLNIGTNGKPAFSGWTPNAFYSSGARLMSADGPVRLANYPEYRSLGDPITLPYRAYPALADLDGDGRVDLLAASGTGELYVYRGGDAAAVEAYAGQQLPAGMKPPDAFGRREALRQRGGAPLTAGAYASLAAYDINADGRPDLLIGQPDGTLAVAYGEDGGVFAPPAPLLAGGQPVRGAPPLAAAIGAVTASGVPDFVVGDAEGMVTLYRGERTPLGALAFGAGSGQFKLPARFAAPSIHDMNGDALPDLVIGSGEGDLRVYYQGDSGTGNIAWQDGGALVGATMNAMGNQALVGGHNAVPLWYDLNHDGKDDLIVGQLEFGIPSNIDDPAFPYAAQLREFIEYTRANKLELYPHLFFHNYVSDAQEKQEIELHRQAFNRLGIPWTLTGANQHTWRINDPNRQQTLTNERDADIWFNFGFKPSGIMTEPRLSVEYYWGLPFLRADASGQADRKRPMLLYTPAPVLRTDASYSTKDLYEAYAALDLPIDYFEHVEYHFPGGTAPLLEFVRYLDTLRNDKSYNFMTEPQMARSFLNALTTDVRLYRPWREAALDRLARLFGRQRDPVLYIEPLVDGVPAEAAEYRGTLGLSIERGAAYATRDASPVNADVFDTRDGKLYFGAPRTTEIRFTAEEPKPSADRLQLLRVNVPYALSRDGAGWKLQLQAPGMQQVRIRSGAALDIQGQALDIQRDEATGVYTVTHFGEPVELSIRAR